MPILPKAFQKKAQETPSAGAQLPWLIIIKAAWDWELDQRATQDIQSPPAIKTLPATSAACQQPPQLGRMVR